MVNTPIADASGIDNTGQSTEEISTTHLADKATYLFTPSSLVAEIQTELFQMSNEDTVLSGMTFINATIKFTFADSTEVHAQSDETGRFELSIDDLVLENSFTVDVVDKEGNTLENLSFTINENIESNLPLNQESKTDTQKKDESGSKHTSKNTPISDAQLEKPISDKPSETTETVNPTEPPILDEPPETIERVSPSELVESNKAIISMYSLQNQPIGTTYYYVKSGDTLYSITQRFKQIGVTIEKLREWNNIVNATLVKAGDILSINGINNYDEYNKVNTTFSSNKHFLDFAGKYAEEVAAEYGLYASVMMAQTSLETGYGKSALSTKANNFFGIKVGSGYTGYSIIMPTWEVVNGNRVETDAEFRFYPTYTESFADNADKLRNGLSNNPNFYNGAWLENTNNFKDATLFLNQRYATDTAYHNKLNNIILSNNLTRFDSKLYVDNSSNAIIINENYLIGNLPLDHRNAHNNVKPTNNTSNYLGSFLTISQVTVNGNYANIYLDGKELGWVHVDSLLMGNQELVNVNFNAYVASKNTPIYSLPLGEKNNIEVAKSGGYMNGRVHVSAQTKNGDQSYITKDGEPIGWILTKDLARAIDTKSVIINSGNYSIDTLPWKQGGNHQKVASTAEYRGQELQVIALSSNGAYSLAHNNGKVLGWIDNKALTDFLYNPKNITDYVTSGNYSIDSLPYGTIGYEKLGNTNSLLGKNIQVTKESSNGSYWFIQSDGKDIGWVDARAFGLAGQSYETLITKDNYSIDSLPWGTPGFKKVASSGDYFNQKVQVVGSTKEGSYLLIRQKGQDLGWVDRKSVLPANVNIVNQYSQYIGSSEYSIDSLPWGTPGYYRVGNTANILGRRVTVVAESSNKAYALISADNLNIGWVDKKAFGLDKPHDTATIVNGKYSVDTLPWGTPGFEKLGFTSEYINQLVEVVGTVQNGSYALIRQNGSDIGWVDHRSLLIIKTVPVNDYSIYIGGSGYSIDSLPWGTPGFKKIGDTSQLLGKIVTVTKESKNRAYAYILVDGTPLGWIDKKAFGLKQDLNSAIIVNGRYSIDNLPWGTPGFEKIGVTSHYVGDFFRIIGSTHNGSYVLINKNNSNIGWVDYRSLEKLNTTSQNYAAQVKHGNYSIDSLPWGTPRFKKNASSSDYLNQEVKVIAESSNKAYVFIQIDGKAIGWIDKKALA